MTFYRMEKGQNLSSNILIVSKYRKENILMSQNTCSKPSQDASSKWSDQMSMSMQNHKIDRARVDNLVLIFSLNYSLLSNNFFSFSCFVLGMGGVLQSLCYITRCNYRPPYPS